jgi:serine/threonine protein phosphatase 1
MPAVTDLNAHDIKVIHGHVPQDKAKESNRRIALDTGAYATGILSAVRLAPGLPLAFVTAESGQVTDVTPMQSAVTKIT